MLGRLFWLLVFLATVIGLGLGLGGSAAGETAGPTSHRPPPPGVTVRVIGPRHIIVTIRFGARSGRPAKPFYGVVSLRLKTLGLPQSRRLCGSVVYSGGVSGWNRICNDLSREIWVRRGNFLTASLRLSSLPAGCRFAAPHTPPHVTKRVNLVFVVDCRGRVTPPPPPPTVTAEVVINVACRGVQGVSALLEVRTSLGVEVITVGCDLIQKIRVPRGTQVEICIFGVPPGTNVSIVPSQGIVFISANCVRFVVGPGGITITLVITVVVGPIPPPSLPGPPPPPPPTTRNLVVRVNGYGRVTSSPSGMDCQGTVHSGSTGSFTVCSTPMSSGSTVTLIATPSDGNWRVKSGCSSSSTLGASTSCQVVMDTEKTVDVIFEFVPPPEPAP